MPSTQEKGRFWTKQQFEVNLGNNQKMLSVVCGS